MERRKLNSELDDFVRWKNLAENYNIEVYIEKEIIPDFKKKIASIVDDKDARAKLLAELGIDV
ncbi:MAG: hypothetical protein P8Y70_17615, partial [Candidatus Lokiarchaeota archaeon]